MNNKLLLMKNSWKYAETLSLKLKLELMLTKLNLMFAMPKLLIKKI